MNRLIIRQMSLFIRYVTIAGNMIILTTAVIAFVAGCTAPPGPTPPLTGPVAIIVAPETAVPGEVVVLDGEASFDTNEVPIKEFLWVQTLGPPVILINPASSITSFLVEVPGFYEFTLTVTNELGEVGVATVPVEVLE